MYPGQPWTEVQELLGEYIALPLDEPVAYSPDMGSDLPKHTMADAPVCVTKYVVETTRVDAGGKLPELNLVVPFTEFAEGCRYLVRHREEEQATIEPVQRRGDRWGFNVFGSLEPADFYDILGRVVLSYTVY